MGMEGHGDAVAFILKENVKKEANPYRTYSYSTLLRPFCRIDAVVHYKQSRMEGRKRALHLKRRAASYIGISDDRKRDRGSTCTDSRI